MKKVSDLRANYYLQLTEKRKSQFNRTNKVQKLTRDQQQKHEVFLKYKEMFKRIVNSEKMQIKLNFKIYRWVKHFIENLKLKICKKKNEFKNKVFQRLNGNKT